MIAEETGVVDKNAEKEKVKEEGMKNEEKKKVSEEKKPLGGHFWKGF